MNQISLDAKGGQFLADLANWQRESAPDNSADLERLRRNLRFARQQVLTKRQQQMLELYYDQGLTMGQIAAKLHLNRSTVCRTIQRGEARLRRCLRYGGERLLRRSESQGDGLGLPTDKRRRGNPCRAPRRGSSRTR